ncbi:MAG: preprotein translocase subunit SecF [Candidatus Paceibacteria bacterium]|jgi:preprotein translocase subunit SecF
MNIVNNKKIFYIFSTLLVVLSLISVGVFGLKFGIDFTGGSVLEIKYGDEVPSKESLEETLSQFELGDFLLRETNSSGYILKTKVIDDSTKNSIIATIGGEVVRFNTIGPTLGDELKTKASVALVVVIVAIIFFMAYTFRHVSKPVSSWKYGFVAIIALLHDVIITLGFFSIMGYLYDLEISTLFVTALLVILGYSINDTIVVLDRVRENLKDKDENLIKARFADIVGKSLKETFARSINTSITTLLALLSLFYIGGESTKEFALALIVGVIVGAYSSLFLAAPMLVSFKEKGEK